MAPQTRAKSPEDKDRRRRLILKAVGRLFRESDYRSITMEAIAERAGLSKGAVFFYFKTKQELFLAYTREEIDGWHDELDGKLLEPAAARRKLGRDEFLDLLKGTIRGRRTLFRLVSIIGSILEIDMEDAALLDFKLHLRDRMMRTGELFEKLLDVFGPGDGIRFYLYMYFIVTGMYPMAEPGPAVRRLHKRRELRMYRMDFEADLMRMLRALLGGWERA